jgi:methylglyoxal synthase
MRRISPIARRKNIALVAHDNRKEELFEWAEDNLELLRGHSLYATGTTGQLLKCRLGLNLTLLECGLLGGDQQIGSRITEGQIDFLILFSDPLEAQPHDADVKALLRITIVWNIPLACNRASADFLISSPLMSTGYERLVPDYSKYKDRLFVDSHSEHAGPGSEGLARGVGVPHQRAILPPNGDVRTTVGDAVDRLWKYQRPGDCDCGEGDRPSVREETDASDRAGADVQVAATCLRTGPLV